mgnify:CR=1 FL=1
MVIMEVTQFMGEDTAHLVHGKLVKEPLKDDDMMVAKSIGVELCRVLDIERKVTAPRPLFGALGQGRLRCRQDHRLWLCARRLHGEGWTGKRKNGSKGQE